MGFRYFARLNAEKLGVAGTVENTADGAVEAVFEGEEGAVRQLVALCRKGPPAAGVRSAEIEYETFRGEFNGLSIE